MKDHRFIELLNLYFDREISPEDAAELEAEVNRSVQRRQLYTQYCRLDRGCTMLLSQNPATTAPKLAAALAEAERKVIEFPGQSGRPSLQILFGGLVAAAAAVALLLATRHSVSTPSLPAAPAPQAPIAVVPRAASGATGREAIVPLPFGEPPVQATTTVSAAYAWMSPVELVRPAPLTKEDVLLATGAEKGFTAGPNSGLHLENARSTTHINAYEVGK